MSISLMLLVFAATSFFFGVMLTSIYGALYRKTEEQKKREEGQLTPMRRFITPEKLLKLRFGWCFLLVAVGTVVLLCKGVLDPWVLIPLACMMGGVGWKLPMLYFGHKIKKRKELFDSQILSLTMTLANGLKSGMALPQALSAAVQNLPEPMKDELAVALRECHLGLELTEALERLYRRMPSEDLRLLITAIRLSQQTGGSLTEVLARMVELIRGRREFQEKVKTMTASGRFEALAMTLAPVVVYVLLRLIDPELMKPLTSTAIGWCTIGGVTLILLLGYFVINKIVTIEV